ncbi:MULTISPECIES: hypothetical protein [unclassified Bradyrhizobium]|nr:MULTISPECIES: hypothetical protein [unclassified Bradyrhizobium]
MELQILPVNTRSAESLAACETDVIICLPSNSMTMLKLTVGT